MNRTGFTLLELLIALTLASILAAIASASVKNAKDAAYVAVLESELEKLALAQEVYFAERAGYFGESGGEEGSYTRRIGRLDFTPSPNVRIRMRANRRGWAARAEHLKRRPERFYCSIFVGEARPYRPATEEGVIECEPRRRRRGRRR